MLFNFSQRLLRKTARPIRLLINQLLSHLSICDLFPANFWFLINLKAGFGAK
jgi:hypothetical protein